MDLKGKTVLVFGTGISGIGAADLLHKVGAKILLYDGNEKLNRQEILGKLPQDCECELFLGDLPKEVLSLLDLVIVSPGVPTDLPLVRRFREEKIPIWGEVELAYRFSRGDVLAVTGTNGKTTTVSILGAILKAYRPSVFVVGNIGSPYTEAALLTEDDSVAVAEISSFQLETIEQFHPKVSSITNITPDHLNRHHTMEEYIRVKERIALNQGFADTCVLNYEDPVLREFGEHLHTNVLFFSSRRVLEKGLYLDKDTVYYRDGKSETKVIAVSDLKLLGVHNYENVMTAAGMALSYGVPLSVIQSALMAFQAVEHRIEYVAEKNGVVYYNDSKGTNPDAAIQAIRAMNRPTVLIGGGYDKDSSYEEWIRAFDGKVKKLVLVGATKEKIAACAHECGFHEILLADTFEEAFSLSVENAAPGDAVLLSPACASWDMFANYEERGRFFKELVNRL